MYLYLCRETNSLSVGDRWINFSGRESDLYHLLMRLVLGGRFSNFSDRSDTRPDMLEMRLRTGYEVEERTNYVDLCPSTDQCLT